MLTHESDLSRIMLTIITLSDFNDDNLKTKLLRTAFVTLSEKISHHTIFLLRQADKGGKDEKDTHAYDDDFISSSFPVGTQY